MIPKSKILSVSKGISAVAELHNNSPTTQQVVNVNISKEKAIDPAAVTYSSDKANANNSNEPITEMNSNSTANPYIPVDNTTNPYTDVKQDANNELLHYKDNVIEALSTMLQIIENNPLIVNKLIVATANDLTTLIKLLTNAEEVQLNLNNDIECSCINNSKYSTIDKIYVIKNGETLNFKYAFPDANKILDDHHISVKLVCSAL